MRALALLLALYAFATDNFWHGFAAAALAAALLVAYEALSRWQPKPEDESWF